MAVNYQCPMCGAMMVFNEKSGMLHCDFCGHEMTVSQMEEHKEKTSKAVTESLKEQEDTLIASEEKGEKTSATDTSGAGKKMFHCTQCGAEIETTALTAATFCQYCGSPVIIEEHINGAFEPSRLIPFKLNKEDCKTNFKKWCGTGFLTPKSFTSGTVIDRFTGIYVPFWLYDYDAQGSISGTATITRITRRGDTEYIYTDHYAIARSGNGTFNKIPADAAENMPDDAMDMLEPFNTGDLKEFQKPYLSGFLADRYTYNGKQMTPRVEARVVSYMKDNLRNTISGYNSVSINHQDIHCTNRNMEYVMFPVWQLDYKYRGTNYHFYMNGQTGTVVGTLPTDKRKAVITGILVFIIVWGIILAIGYFLL